MARKRKSRSLWAGYAAYRYGAEREVLLPGQASKNHLRGVRRKQAVEDVVDVLKGWTRSPFEYEGAVRAGLRVGLVLEGQGWARADYEAAMVTEEAFRTIGAERPTWEEGQHRYTDRMDFCMWCGKAMPDELVSGGRNQLYCCSECAKAAVLRNGEGEERLYRATRKHAFNIVRRERLPKRDCAFCGTPFVPANSYKNSQIYCSRECSAKAHPPTFAECPQCHNQFKVEKSGNDKASKFCSITCAADYGRTPRYERSCQSCGVVFMSKMPHGKYCSTRCNGFASTLQRGQRNPRRINLQLFDYLFTAPIAVSRFEAQQEPPEAGEVVTLSFSQSPSQGKREPSTAMFLTSGIFDQMMAA